MARAKSEKAIINFNAGEFSPLLDARADLEKANAACRVLENVVIEHYGEARRRAGTQYVATVSNTYTSS
jgi:hypothetical protein